MRISDWSSDVCSSDLLRGRKPPQLHEDLYARAEAVLKRDGIAHADLLAPLVDGKADGATFLRTDTHWTPRGAQLAAAAIAQTVRGELPAPTAPARYQTPHDAPRAHLGDLLHFLPLDPYFLWLLPATDTLTPAHPEGTASGALFGDSATPRLARKSAVPGKGVSCRVALGGPRWRQKQKQL